MSYSKDIQDLEDDFFKKIRSSSKQLAKAITELLYGLETDKGVLLSTNISDRLYQRIEEIFADYKRGEVKEIIAKFTETLERIIVTTVKIYDKPLSSRQVLNIKEKIFERYGLEKDGTVRKKGYMFQIFSSDEVKSRLFGELYKDLVNRRTLKDAVAKYKTYIIGTERKDGILSRYYKGFIGDTFAHTAQIANNNVAQELKLEYFIYAGGLIDTTRAFCEKRNGKAFSIYEGEAWKEDEDLIDKDTKEMYDWEVDNGRYNCRHYKTYISEGKAFAMRPELKVFKSKTKEEKNALGARLAKEYLKSMD